MHRWQLLPSSLFPPISPSTLQPETFQKPRPICATLQFTIHLFGQQYLLSAFTVQGKNAKNRTDSPCLLLGGGGGWGRQEICGQLLKSLNRMCWSRINPENGLRSDICKGTSAPRALKVTKVIDLYLKSKENAIEWFLLGFLFFKNKLIYLFIYLLLCWVFVAVHRLSLVAASGGLLFVAVRGLLIAVASLVAEHGL